MDLFEEPASTAAEDDDYATPSDSGEEFEMDTQTQDPLDGSPDPEPAMEAAQGSSAPDSQESRPQSDAPASILAGTYAKTFPVYTQGSINSDDPTLTPTTGFITGGPTYSLAFSAATRYLFTGGEDGFIRRFAFPESVNGSQPMTIGQRPTFMDTIVNAGVLKAYWENEQPLEEHEYKFDQAGTYMPRLSPVYSLAVHSEALWLVSGLESGGISLQTARYSEGTIVSYLDLHTSAVSELVLSPDERTLLSGSWDKTVGYWDLDSGKCTSQYTTPGQVSTISWQPAGGPPPSNDDIDDLFGEEAAESEQIFMTSSINGSVDLWDTRTTNKVLSLSGSSAPPWCLSACWSNDGTKVYAGRRNNTVDEWDIRKPAPRTLKLPSSSGGVTSVLALGNRLLCASQDNLRVYDLQSEKSTPFKIAPSYHGTTMSRMILDKSGRYLLTASGGRGWSEGQTSDMILCYEVE